MLKLFVFDVAGTTVYDGDNAVARCLCDALDAAGTVVPLEAVDPVMGWRKPLAIKSLLTDTNGSCTDADVDAVHSDFQARIIEHYRTAEVRPISGAEQVFQGLRSRGVKVALDTGFDRATLDTILTRLGWDDSVIDGSVTSDEVANGRPAPDMIYTLMERFGVAEASAVGKIGDSVSDIEQGLNAGCGLVAAMMCDRTRAIINDFPSARAVEELPELLDLVDAMAGEASPAA